MIIFMLFACGESKSNDPNIGDYPVETSELDALDGCDTFTDTDGSVYPKEAATAYASGLYTISGSELTGTEKIHLIPTDAWSNAGSSQPDWEPCELIWSVIGSEITPTSGDYAIAVTATFQPGSSSCPDFVKEAYNSDFSSNYNIARDGSGNATWTYQSSGTTFGEGTYTDTSLNFLSEPVCENLGNVQTQ